MVCPGIQKSLTNNLSRISDFKMDRFTKLNLKDVETPCFIIDKNVIRDNLEILKYVQQKADCKILLALKAYAMYPTFPLIKKCLHGICAGSLYEAKLGRKKFGKEVHTYSPAFKEKEFPEILNYSDYIIFNSFSQFEKFMPAIKKNKKKVKVGLRVNPEKSVAGALFSAYDPCMKNSRLGVTSRNLQGKNLEGITGLHFHALCEQGAEELEEVLKSFEEKFDDSIKRMRWVNFGGGHHITKKGYDTEKLCSLVQDFRRKYPNIKDVYLEPGEAVVLNAGILVASVLDIVHNEKDIAILDTSVETHFPDVLITRHEPKPYMQEILGAETIKNSENKKYLYNYILTGVSCAAGDVFGEYFFPNPLKPGDKLIFTDAAHYTIVKTSTFCGVNLPSIALINSDGSIRIIKKFGYADYKNRLS